MRAGLLIVVALATAAGCKQGGSEPAPAAGSTPGAGAPTPSVPTQGLQRRTLAPIGVDEIPALLPDRGWTALAEPVSVNGTQVRATYCVTGTTLEATTAAVTEALSDRGWTNVNSRAHPRRPNRYGISAQRTPFRMTGQVFAERPECANGDARFYTELTIHKVEAGAGANRTPPGPAPRRGPR